MAEKKETESTPVKMTDGRIVEFSGKQKMKKEGYEADGQLYVRFDFITGDTLTYTLPPSLYKEFALHGAGQKIGDEAAGEKSVEDAYVAIETIMARLTSPEGWKLKAGTGGFAGSGVVIRALMEASGFTREQANAWIDNKIAADPNLTRQKIYASLRGTARLAPIIQRLEAEATKKHAATGEALISDLPA